jgi:hypothetical protein
MELSKEMLIRTVVPNDFAQWKSLWDGYNAFYGRKDKTAFAGRNDKHDVVALLRRL